MNSNRMPRDVRTSSAPDDSRRGSISILSAVAAIVLVALIGLGLDTALVYTARQQLQRTADACALAAVAKIRDGTNQATSGNANFSLVRQLAIDTAAALSNDIVRCGQAGIVLEPNFANVDDPTNQAGDIVVGRWTFNTTTHLSEFVPMDPATGTPRPDAVRVRAKCASPYSQNTSLQLLFGQLFGVGTSDVGREAIARLAPPDEALVLVLDPHKRASLNVNGGAYLDVLAGTIQVDSDHACGLNMNGVSGLMEAQRFRVVGPGACVDPLNLNGSLIPNSPYVADPLLGLPEPSTAGMTNFGGISGPGIYPPGYYPDGIDANGGVIQLNDGIYVIGGNPPARGIDLNGDALIVGTRVLVYLEANARVDISGSGAGMELTPMNAAVDPTAGDVYATEGVTVFHARTSTLTSDINGGGVFDVRGTYYVPNGLMRIGGDTTRVIGRIIVDELELYGNTRFLISGDAVPPSDDPPSVFLVL